jgi:hypothetical protein
MVFVRFDASFLAWDPNGTGTSTNGEGPASFDRDFEFSDGEVSAPDVPDGSGDIAV